MKYRVLWSPQAEQRLESIIKRAAAPVEVVDASQKIDWQLLSAPNSFGESRSDQLRIGFAEPLAVLFEVMDDVRTAIVYDVWRTDRK